jgi:hypothetical protein
VISRLVSILVVQRGIVLTYTGDKQAFGTSKQAMQRIAGIRNVTHGA